MNKSCELYYSKHILHLSTFLYHFCKPTLAQLQHCQLTWTTASLPTALLECPLQSILLQAARKIFLKIQISSLSSILKTFNIFPLYSQ